MTKTIDKFTLSLAVRDKPGVLVRIALVFARRGYNIESLSVSPGSRDGFARMTIESSGDPGTREQIIKQLRKLIDVVYVTDHADDNPIETEIALIKLGPTSHGNRTELMQIAEHYKAKVVHYSAETLILRVEGNREKLAALFALLAPHNIEEVVRSGAVVMSREPSIFKDLLSPDDGE
jgi:acetolactate synthase small subunit